jgi:hypothetical protein
VLVARDDAWLGQLRRRDALAPAERPGWNLSRQGYARARFDATGLSFELAPDATKPAEWNSTGTLVFGANEGWRDYEVELEYVLESGGFWLIDRCGATGGGSLGTVRFTPGSNPLSPLLEIGVEVEAGRPASLVQRVVGGAAEQRPDRALREPSASVGIDHEARIGGFGLTIPSGTKLRITKLAVRVLRVDTAQ